MMKAAPTSMLWRGATAIAIGIVVIAWPGITDSALVVLFAAYVFAEAAGHFARLLAVRQYYPMVWHLLLALLDIAVGIVALSWPGIADHALTTWVGIWAVVTGAAEVAAVFVIPGRAVTRIATVLGGAIVVLFGVTMFAHSDAGTVNRALLLGLWSLAYGVNLLISGIGMRRKADVS